MISCLLGAFVRRCRAVASCLIPSAVIFSCASVGPRPVLRETSPADDPYLAPDAAGGSPYCFNPQSRNLRRFVARERPEQTFALDAADLASDIGHLHGAMKKLYAGYPELLQDPSFDVGSFFARWEENVRAARTTVDFEHGVLRPLVELRRHIRDQHLFVNGWGARLAASTDLTFSEYQSAERGDGVAIGSCDFGALVPVPGTVRIAKQLDAKGLSDVVTFSARSVAPVADIKCGARTIHFERRVSRAVPAEEHAPPYEWRSVGDAAVLTIRNLSGSAEVEETLSQIARDYDEHRKKRTVVFDFRGNGGGNDQFVLDWIAKARSGPWQLPFVAIRLPGAAKACGTWNQLVLGQMSSGSIESSSSIAERTAFLTQSPLGGVRGAPSQLMTSATMESTATSPFTGRVFVLVDHASTSSGETAPEELRRALGATVVGERTAGFLEYGDIKPYVMPRTGVLWAMASARFYYAEPRDGVGAPVDVYLDPALLAARVEQLLPLLGALPRM